MVLLCAAAHAGGQPVRVDTNFVVNLDAPVWAVQTQADGGILLGGEFTNINGRVQAQLARLASTGVLDESFRPAPTGTVTRILQMGSSIYAAVQHADVPPFEGYNGSDIRALTLSGELKSVYHDGAVWWYYPGFAVNSQFRLIYGQPRSFHQGEPALICNDESGRWCDGFGADVGCCPDDSVYSVAFQNDNGTEKILVGGDFGSVWEKPQAYLARLNADGSFDPSFNATAYEPASDIELWKDGKFYTATGHSIQRRLPDGSIDPSFAIISGGSGISFWSVLPLESGGVITFGDSCGAICEPVVFRYNPDGTRDTNFSVHVDGYVMSLAIQPDGGILIGGRFTNVNCIRSPYLARLIPSDTPDPLLCVPPPPPPPKPEPQLDVTRISRWKMVCCWPTNYPEYTLQAARVVHPKHPERDKWKTVTNAPAMNGDHVCVTNRVLRWGRNYRLVK